MVKCIDVVRLKYKSNGCTACMGCQNSDEFECVIDDEASPILKTIPEYDALVMATPVYWCGPSAQLKVFTDRMHSLVKYNAETNEFNHGLGGKTLGLIATGGGDYRQNIDMLEQQMKACAGFLEMKFECLAEALAPSDPKDMAEKVELKQRAVAFGSKLAQ